MEPAQGLLGCKVNAFADQGPGKPGQARLSNQIRPGDVVVEINDEVVSHLSYNDIIDRLKQLAQMPRKMLFRSAPPAFIVDDTVPARATPKPLRSFHLTSNGALTPVISPSDDNAKSSISSVLFMDPTTLSSRTSSPAPHAATGSVPSSPAYMSPAQQDAFASSSEANVVLDVKDNTSQSIDSSSIISPSKVKNLSQEDLELGLGHNNNHRKSKANTKKPLANVFRTVYNSVMVGRVGSFDFGASSNNNKMPFKDDGPGSVPEKQMEESFHKKSQMVQDLEQVSMVVDDIYFGIDQKTDDSSEKVSPYL